MSGGDGSPQKIARHDTTTLDVVLQQKYPGYAAEDIFWWPTQAACSKSIGRPWRCADCRSKSCCNHQAFDCISYEQAITPGHQFKRPIHRKSPRQAELQDRLNKELDEAIDANQDPSDTLLDQLTALEDTITKAKFHTDLRRQNIATKLEVLCHHAKVRTDTEPLAEGIRQSQPGRSKRRKCLADHRAKRQKQR